MVMNYIIFDCDTGSDDAIALMMLLTQPDKFKTVAVTCVQGNTDLDNVVMNNLRILKLYNQLGKIPVYKGCRSSLIPAHQSFFIPHVHGEDGMGGDPGYHPSASADLLQHLEKEHAVNAIIKYSKQYSGKLKIVATGPLTNIAMAVKMDPDLPSRLDSVYIMGGTRFARGNLTPAAEFNFHVDPEAAYITLHCYSSKCPVHLINYEVTDDNPVSWSFVDEWLSPSEPTEKCLYAKMILKPLCKLMKGLKARGLVICDAYAMAVAMDPSVGVTPQKVKVCVELGGHHCRGHVVIDHFHRNDSFPAVIMYDSFDIGKFCTALKEMVK